MSNMRVHRNWAFVFLFLVITTLLASPIYLKLNFDHYNLLTPDSFYMLTNWFWAGMIILSLSLIGCFFSSKRLRFLLPFSLSLLLLVFYPLIQLPSLPGDTIYHMSSTKVLTDTGRIYPEGYVEYPGTYYLAYPGSFIVSNFLGEISGASLLQVTIFLYLVLQLLSVTLLYKLGQKFIGHQHGYLAPFVYLLGNFGHGANLLHFSPQLFALVLYLLFIYVCLRFDSLAGKLSLFLLGTAIVLSHPITTLFMIASLIGLRLVQRIFKTKLSRTTVMLLGFLFVVWLLWTMFQAEGTLTKTMKYIASIFPYGIELGGYIDAYVTKPSRTFYSELFWMYREAFHLFVALSAILGVVWGLKSKEKAVIIFSGILLGLVSVALPFLAITPGTWLDRFVLFTYVSVSLLSVLGIKHISKHTPSFSRIFVVLIIILIPFSLIAGHQNDYVYFTHVWETGAVGFLTDHWMSGASIGTDIRTVTILRFYDLAYTGERAFRFWPPNLYETDFQMRIKEFPTFFVDHGTYIIRSYMHNAIYRNATYWRHVDTNIIHIYNRIYDSQYMQEYYKP